MYFEIDTFAGTIGLNEYKDGIHLTAHRGRDVRLEIPGKVVIPGRSSESDIIAIDKKAFLSDKNLHSVVIPENIKRIGDWAFAGCRNLEKISLGRDVVLGNGVFKDCEILRQVDLGDESDIGYLLAAVIYLLDDKFLFDLENAGSKDWLENWDKRMEVILNEPDEEGFQALLACGEEDYEGRDNTLEAYLVRRRSRKVRLCMLRLLHDIDLTEERRLLLKDYLYRHRAGQPEQETWHVVLNEHGDEEEYYELLYSCDCVDHTNINLMLTDLGDKHARMKAYLLKNNNESASDTFFDGMDL